MERRNQNLLTKFADRSNSCSASELTTILSVIVDAVVEHDRLPDDAKRGVLSNMLEYIEQSRSSLEFSEEA
jgi:hypothetical protein